MNPDNTSRLITPITDDRILFVQVKKLDFYFLFKYKECECINVSIPLAGAFVFNK
ncbi:MAG: hypothetical protein JETCAE03_15200 [Ignavibacteriaceae bacterium]|jgi:hypothetical protein|nr:MAG: hypothetical protein BroJett017_08280 [Ignavibacteriota bacterium]GJQ42022.1 MAG: hypothetical protein JETCAE03_15200 [Ignavibacteriaceae bacterium]